MITCHLRDINGFLDTTGFYVIMKFEHVVVNQVVEEVNPPVEVRFDICGTTPEPNFFVNEGKPRMHLTYLVFYKFISLFLLYTALSD